MDIVGLGYHFEDLTVGRRFRTISRTVTEPDIVNYVNATGMVEVLFTDMEYVRGESAIQGRFAPAMLAYGLAEGLLAQATMQHTALALLELALTVQAPVFVGDTIHVRCEVTEARRSRSRPDRGLIRTRNEIVRQNGDVVIVYQPLRMIKARTNGDDDGG